MRASILYKRAKSVRATVVALQKTAIYGAPGRLATLKSGGVIDLEVLNNFAFMLKVAKMHRWPRGSKIAFGSRGF